MFVALKPIKSGRDSVDKVMTRIRNASAKEPGAQLFLQPIQDLRTGAVASEELLVRMKMPDGQLIAPFAFLPWSL